MNQRWEYRVMLLGGAMRGLKPEELENLLNEAAADGWELVSITSRTNSNRFLAILRRELERRPERRSSRWP